MMRIVTLALFLMSALPAFAQYETPDDVRYSQIEIPRTQLRWIIDTPTAGMLPRGTFDLDLRTFNEGGLQASLGIGLMNRFSVGLAYGASSVLSDTMPDWNPRLEFLLRYRLLEEGPGLPAAVVGFNSQGYGPYIVGPDRFRIKSTGFYLAFSKNFRLYENPAGWHGGINYSLENELDNDPSAFIGFNADLGNNMLYLAEYDFALNDNSSNSISGRGRGYLNMGLVWYLTDDLSLELDLKDLLQNRRETNAIDREARLVYVEYFY